MGGNLQVILILVINFIILFVVLKKALFSRVMQHLDSRKKEIDDTFNKIDLDKKEIARLSEEYQSRIVQIEKEAYQKIQSAIKEGLNAKTGIISEAHSQANNVLRKAKVEIDHEKKKALTELKNEMVTLVIAAASRVIEEKMDEKIHAKLVEKFINDLESAAPGK